MTIYRRKDSPKWWLRVVAPDGRRVRIPAYTNRRASEELDRRLRELSDVRQAYAVPPPDLARWVESLPPDVLSRLADHGFVKEGRAENARPLADHLEDWHRSMMDKGDCPRHAQQHRAQVARLARECRWRALCDLSADALSRWAGQARDDGMAPRTVNSYLAAAKGFSRWCARHARIATDPLAYVSRVSSGEKRVRRRTLTDAELGRLLHAADTGPDFRGMDGPTWGLLFRVAMATGYRWSELRALIVSSFSLNASPPVATLDGDHTKNGQAARQPIPTWLVPMLRDHLAGKMPMARAFAMPPGTVGSKAVKLFMDLAGLEYVDAAGRRFDFHALRAQYGTNLARAGVPLATAQKLLRHHDPKLTSNHYSLTTLGDHAEAVERVPEPTAPADAESARATGTDDERARERDNQFLPNRTIPDNPTQGSHVKEDDGCDTDVGSEHDKALQASDLQGWDCGGSDGTRTRSLQIDSLKARTHNPPCQQDLTATTDDDRASQRDNVRADGPQPSISTDYNPGQPFDSQTDTETQDGQGCH